jgi:hypothetical protein
VPDDPQKRDPLQPNIASTETGDRPADPPADQADPPADQDEDRFRPDAIAARVDQIGDETELERVARQEEQKLLERKKQQKKGKRGLEAAASKRLARIGEGTVKRPSAAAADAYIPEADPLLERVRRARKWIDQHRQVFGGLVAIAVIGVGGALGYTYWLNKRAADGSALLAQGFAAEHGHVSDKDDDDDDSPKTKQLYPTFKSAADRRGAALARYREVETKYPGTGAAILARLAEAGLLLDQGDSKGAIAAYVEVKASPLAQADPEVRGRALEGLGFAHELVAQSGGADKDAQLDGALTEFKALEQVDVTGFKELGMYHQARVLQAKGDRAKAIEILKELHKRVSEPVEGHPFSYLEFVVDDHLRELDPAALPPKASKRAAPGPGGLDMNNPQVQELLRQLQQKGAPSPVAPNGPR